MRSLVLTSILISAIGVGCATRDRTPPARRDVFAPVTYSGSLIVTPEYGLAGKVVRVNSQGKFVVLNFPPGRMPAIDQRLTLYRRGLKAGEVKITGPQRDDNIVADIVRGDAEPGDEVRDR